MTVPAARPSRRMLLLTLAALAAVVFLGKSYEVLLRGIDSNVHSSVAMSVTSQGLEPRLPIPIKNFTAPAGAATGSAIDPNRYFNDHPFFGLWLTGRFMRLFGPSAWSARFLTGLFSVGSVLVTYALGAALVSEAFGALAAVFLIFTRDFVLTSGGVSLDTGMIFFLLLSFLFWQRKRWVAMGLAAGLGLWIKTPVVLLAFPTAFIVETVERNLRRALPRLALGFGVALAVGSLVWIYTGLRGGWDLVADYWSRQLWGTAVGGRGGGSDLSWTYVFYNIRTGFVPGLPFLLVGIAQVIRKRQWLSRGFAVPLTAIAVLTAALGAMRYKLGSYYTPIFPFLALISAYSCAQWVEERFASFASALTALTLLLFAVLLITPTPLAPEAFVALKRFTPLIQTHGTCDDRVLLVPGGEPAGSGLDYTVFLTFYTGRTVDVAECAGAREALRAHSPQWILLSQVNLRHCFAEGELKPYASRFRVGDQILLTDRIPRNDEVDLTPLEVELKAVTDCKAPPYPQDLWHHYPPEQLGSGQAP